jgi:outer membrane protein OmpA-like peptidoglycan-associated protein
MDGWMYSILLGPNFKYYIEYCDVKGTSNNNQASLERIYSLKTQIMISTTTNYLTKSLMAIMLIWGTAIFTSCGSDDAGADAEKSAEQIAADLETELAEAAEEAAAELERERLRLEEMAKLDSESVGSGNLSASLALLSASKGQVMILDKIPFEGEDLSDDAKAQLDELAEYLKANPELKMEIQGHTTKAKNAVGKASKKTATSVRAVWVKAKLTMRGVPSDQLDSNGYGDEELLPNVAEDDASQKRIAVAMN